MIIVPWTYTDILKKGSYRMEDGYKKIFWGLFIATFNIKLGYLTILPGFIGWIIIFWGFSQLNKEAKEVNFSKAHSLSILLMLVTLFESLAPFFGGLEFNLPLITFYYPILIMCLELAIFHSMLVETIDNFQELKLVELVERYSVKDKLYIILMGLSVIILILGLTMVNETVVFLAVALAVITRIYLMTTISNIRKEFA